VRQMRRQRGATIIIVLMILVVITVLGIAAIRMGLTSLSIATNSQINGLLFQSSDNGLISFEQRVLANPAAAALPDGAIGPALNTPGIDIPFCVTKADRMRAGNCAAGTAADFASARDAVVNQVAVFVPMGADGSPLKLIVLGTDMDRAGISTYRVTVHSTSVLPVFGSATDADINGCFALPSDDIDNPAIVTVTDCLATEGAVFNTMMQEYDYGYN